MYAKTNPYRPFRFVIEINGMQIAAFSEVNGLSIETTVKTFREGGVNDMEYKIPEYTKYGNIVLKRGITDCDILWKWYEQVILGKKQIYSGSIILQNEDGSPGLRWNFRDAYPVKWDGPDFNATAGNVIAMEKVELVHHGLTRG